MEVASPQLCLVTTLVCCVTLVPLYPYMYLVVPRARPCVEILVTVTSGW